MRQRQQIATQLTHQPDARFGPRIAAIAATALLAYTLTICERHLPSGWEQALPLRSGIQAGRSDRMIGPGHIEATVSVRGAELALLAGHAAPSMMPAEVNQVWLKIYLKQADLARLQLNEQVDIRLDGASDRFYQGRVNFISPEEFIPDGPSAARVVRILVDNSAHELQPGMRVNALVEPSIRPESH
jgi:hypothetical protein